MNKLTRSERLSLYFMILLWVIDAANNNYIMEIMK